MKHGVIANVLESKIPSLVSCPCKAIFRGLDDFRAFVDPPYRTETKNNYAFSHTRKSGNPYLKFSHCDNLRTFLFTRCCNE